MLNINESIQKILTEVEEITGRKVRFQERKDLPTQVRMLCGNPNDPYIDLHYRADFDDTVNYAIAVACGHILRLYSAPKGKRYIAVANRRTMALFLMETEEEIKRLSYFFPREQMKVLLPLWYEGVIYQLTTMPPEIMTNKWIYNSFPELRPAMLKSLSRQRAAAIQALSPEVKKITPSLIYNASNIMNYVYFKILENFLHFDYVAPYHKTAFIYEGSALARLTERLHENSHEGDRTVIDLWSIHLNLVNWYEWRSFDTS